MTNSRDLANLGGGFIQAGGGVQRSVESKLKDVVSVKDFGAVGDGVTNDTAAIQAANNAAAVAGKSLYFPSGVYGVRIGSGAASSLNATTSWYGNRSTIKQLNYTNSTATYLITVDNQSNLTISGLTFDGQVTAVGQPVNGDLPDMSTDTNTENNWSKTYGLAIRGSSNVTVIDCVGKNFLRASFRCDNDSSPSNPCSNVAFIRCQSQRNRGIFGDGFYHTAINGVTYESCYAYDFTRIGFVSEYTGAYGSYNVQYSNCLAKYGHHWVGTENNVGFWVEQGDTTSFNNCIVQDVPVGFTGASAFIAGVTGVTRPLSAVLNYSNCLVTNCGTGWYLTTGSQDTTFNLNNCFSQVTCSDISVDPKTKTRSYFAGIVCQFNFNQNNDVVLNVTNSGCEINNDATTISGPYGGININLASRAASTANFDVSVTGFTTSYTHPVKFLGHAESAAANAIPASDLLLRGAQEAPSQPADPEIRLDKVVNLSAPAFYIGGLPGNKCGINVEHSKVSINIPQASNISYFKCSSCDLVDIREIGVDLLQVCDSKIEHANAANPGTAYWFAKRLFMDRNVVTRPTSAYVNGASSSTFRPILVQISNCDFIYNFTAGPIFFFRDADTNADALYALFNNNTFRHTVAGNTGTGITGAIEGQGGSANYLMGSGNLFDDRIGVIYRRTGFSFDTDPTNMAGYYHQSGGHTVFGQFFYVGA